MEVIWRVSVNDRVVYVRDPASLRQALPSRLRPSTIIEITRRAQLVCDPGVGHTDWPESFTLQEFHPEWELPDVYRVTITPIALWG